MSSEIGTPQIIPAVARAAATTSMAARPSAVKPGDQTRRIEGGMNGVAGARMIEREVEQRVVGRLAPARPSPTRAGVRCRRSRSDRGGAGGRYHMSRLFGRNRGLAQPDRIVRRVLLAAATPRART